MVIFLFIEGVFIICLIVIADITIIPPTIDQGPGASFSSSNTQMGFRMGSITVISIVSSAVNLLIAIEYRI